MLYTYLGLVAYGTISCFCLLYKLNPFVKMHEVDWSKTVLSVLKRIDNNSNRLKQIKPNRLDVKKYLMNKDKRTDNGFRNIYSAKFDIVDKKSTVFWLASNISKNIYSKKTRTRQITCNQRRQMLKYQNNNRHNSTSYYANKINSIFPRYQYGCNINTKLKISNQKHHKKECSAKNSNLTTENTLKFGDGNTSASEDVKLENQNLSEKFSDLKNITYSQMGLGANISVSHSFNGQKRTPEIVITEKSKRDNMNDDKLNKMLMKTSLDTWIQHNRQNITGRKISRKIRFASWPARAVVNTLINSLSDVTATSDTGVADKLRKRVRVLCWIMISTPEKLNQTFLTAITNTWGRRCTKVLFMSSGYSAPVPIVKLPGSMSNWGRTKEAFRLLYQHHLSDADWFLKTDDSTYVIMENLMYMLSEYNPKEPLCFGSLNESSTGSLMTEKSSYVLSRETLERFESSSTPFKCGRGDDDGTDAVSLGLYHESPLVDLRHTTDSNGRVRYFTYASEDSLLIPEKENKTLKKKKKTSKKKKKKGIHKKKKQGIGCCSDYTILFHHKNPMGFYLIEYLVYHLRPYGVRFVAADNIAGPVAKIPNQPKQIKDSDSVIAEELNEERDRNADRSVADEMARRVRVLCWVMTFPSNHKRRAVHVKATWGKRCNKLLFMSSKFDPDLGTIGLPVKESYGRLWGKTKEAFRYVYEHHREEADWFMKVDDDSYVVVENLRYMLSKYNSTDPMYFGLRYKFDPSFMAGGPGYVLSRAALDKFVTEALPQPHLCLSDAHSSEDIEMGSCLSNVGVKLMDSRDSTLRGRFFHSPLSEHYFPDTNSNVWLKNHMYYGMPKGLKCCSKYAISFHYIGPDQMHVMEYIVYHLKVYGYLWTGTESEVYLNKKLSDKDTRNFNKNHQNWAKLAEKLR